MGCSSGKVSCATFITEGWCGKTIDAGRVPDRSGFPGGPADGSGEVKRSSTDALLVTGGWGCWEIVVVVVVEDEFAELACCQGTGRPPNADLNDSTIYSQDARVNNRPSSKD